MKELLVALSKAKKEIGSISKDSENPFFKSKYFDINKLLEQVEPVLEKHGLLLTQPITDSSVMTVIYHIDSGLSLDSCLTLPQLSDPQKMGSAITYYRRYTLQSLLSLQSVDDDGNLASGKTEPKKPSKEELTPTHPRWAGAVQALKTGQTTVNVIKKAFSISPENFDKLLDESI